jgi:uncharacterized protein (TIGR03435 family)
MGAHDASTVIAVITSALFLSIVGSGIESQARPPATGVVQAPKLLADIEAAGIQLEFEIASVKPSRFGDAPYSRFPLGPGDAYTAGGVFSARNQPLINYVRFAYKLPQVDVSGLPDWAYTEAFDIEAHANGTGTKDQMRRMMQALLVERFKLSAHLEQRTGRALKLVLVRVGQLGPQLQVHSESNGSCARLEATQNRGAPRLPAPPSPTSGLQLPDIPCGSTGPIASSSPDRGRIGGRDVPMARIAAILSNPFTAIEQPVIDETGLKGTYDFSLEWTLPRDPFEPADSPNIRQALQEQLGLRLESTTAGVAVRVIDYIERPSPN